MPEITIKLGDQILQTCRFDGELLRIGRSRENDIVLENLSVSRDHAQIRLHDGQFILTDLNSANGTLVNGVRVTKTEVVDEDVITVGKHKLHFRNPVVASVAKEDELADAVRTVMVEPRAEAWLIVESGRLKDREFRITRFETSLGKAASNDVVITDDWLLAKKQAIILRKGNNAFEVQDLGGLRKVKVNGTAVEEKADIFNGDLIEMGGTKLRFHSSAPQHTPTGRVPREISPDNEVAPEANREAGSLNGSRRHEHAARKAAHVFAGVNEDSMDLEEGFQSIRMSLVDESGTSPSVANSNPEQGEEPEAACPDEETPEAPVEPESLDLADESLPTPMVPLESTDAVPAYKEPEPQSAYTVNGNRHVQTAAAAELARRAPHQPFDDQRSSVRRKRKHHQRAAQKQNPSTVTPKKLKAAASSQTPKSSSPALQHSELTSEKEIVMWEEALKNPSPAIQRQAVKMLKKLTGKDYEA